MPRLLNPDAPAPVDYNGLVWERTDYQGVNQVVNLPYAQFTTSPVRVADLNAVLDETNADIGAAQAAAIAAANQYTEDRIRAMDRSKPPVTAASMINIPLNSAPGVEIDGIPTATDDIYGYLLLGQDDPLQNGFYIQTATGLVRRADSDTAAELPQNTAVSVRQGDTLANHTFMMTNDTPPVVGTTPIFFADVTPTAIAAGAGLYYDSPTNSHNIGNTDGSITVGPDEIHVSEAYTQSRRDELAAARTALQLGIDAVTAAEQADRTDINNLTARLTDDEQIITQHTGQISGLTTRLTTDEGQIQTLYSNEQSIFAWATDLWYKPTLADGYRDSRVTGAAVIRTEANGGCYYDVPLPDSWGNAIDVGGLYVRNFQTGQVLVPRNGTGDIVTVNGRRMLRVNFSPAIPDNVARMVAINPVNSPMLINF
jgi:hypothetical protein